MRDSHNANGRSDENLQNETLTEIQRMFNGFRAEMRNEMQARRPDPTGVTGGASAGAASVRQSLLSVRGRTRARGKGARGGGHPATNSTGESMNDWLVGDEGSLPMKISKSKNKELSKDERVIRKELYVRVI